MNEGQIAIVVSRDRVKMLRRWLDVKDYVSRVKVIDLAKENAETVAMEDYELTLVCIQSFGDYLKGLCIQKKFAKNRTVFIICSDIFTRSFLGHFLNRSRIECQRGEFNDVIDGILDMVTQTNLTELDSDDFIVVCDSEGISCNYYIGEKEEVVQRVCSDRAHHKQYRLLNIIGDVGLQDVMDICSAMEETDDVIFGSGYVEGESVKVFVIWQDE